MVKVSRAMLEEGQNYLLPKNGANQQNSTNTICMKQNIYNIFEVPYNSGLVVMTFRSLFLINFKCVDKLTTFKFG